MNNTRSSKLITDAIDANFTSVNESDSNFEPANVVDGLFAVARAIRYLADTIAKNRPE